MRNDSNLIFYEKMYRIRRFEESVLELFSQNKLSGTTHTSIGQEAVAVAAMSAIGNNDLIFSNHRCHGHFIAYTSKIDLLLAEIMGRSDGMCKGLGGSQHIFYGNFYTNGIQGGIVPNATGMALAEKLRQTEAIGMVFLGDGTLGQGIVYESLNLAALWMIPILYVIENNHYAMSTKDTDAIAGDISSRVRSFGIGCQETSSDDVDELSQLFCSAIDYVRTMKKPYCQIVNTYRLSPHSKGDDYRDDEELAFWKKNDPLKKQRSKCNPSTVAKIEEKVEDEIKNAIIFAENSPIYSGELFGLSHVHRIVDTSDLLNHKNQKCIVRLRTAFHEAMDQNSNLLFIGEDIRDPFGGAFKATSGLSTKYPKRVLNTPISEAGFTGVGVGLALNGMLPVVEIMFGDFITLCIDQIANHASKYYQMYAGQKNVPLLIRTPMGGRRGYGPTHSQSLEKLLMGIPNINIVALSLLHDPITLFKQIIENISLPTVLIEDKKTYACDLLITKNGMCGEFFVEVESNVPLPVIKLTLNKGHRADIALITYGASLPLAMETAIDLMINDEITVDILLNTSISPLHNDYLLKNIKDIPSILTLEDATLSFGWGAEVIASLTECSPNKKYARIAANDSILPCCAELEELVLPRKVSIIKKARELYEQSNIDATIRRE